MGCVSSKARPRRAAGSQNAADAWDGRVHLPGTWSVEPAITSEQLARLRNEFWETRIEGRKEMWQALRFAAEADSDELRDETVKAAGLRPANKRGTLLTTYDERGAMYECPMYVLRPPSNLDGTPACAQFKDAARTVTEYIEGHRPRMGVA